MTTLRDIPAIRAEAERRAQRAFDAEKVHADKHGGGDHWAYRGGFAARTPVSKAWAVEAQLDILTDLTDPHNRDVLVRLIDRYGDARDTDEATHSRDDAASLRLITLRVLGGAS